MDAQISSMDLNRLRDILGPLIAELRHATTHNEMPALCQGLGLPAPQEEGSKADRLSAAFDSVDDTGLPDVAERLLRLRCPASALRNQIQDLLWADTPTPEIPKRYRRDLARALDTESLFLNAERFDQLLDSLWVLDDDPLDFLVTPGNRSLRYGIDRHVHKNPGDWSVEYLFERLGAYECSNRRFILFLEGLASAEVCPDEPAQRRFVEVVNNVLAGCGVELREVETEGGYPVFRVASTHLGCAGRPKNLIFASSVKPDIRFRDAVSNDIEIVTNCDKVLVYDLPLSADGLRWRDLQAWWKEKNNCPDERQAKETLYRRLRGSLPESSPPQLHLFDSFYRGYGSVVPEIPALLPEVWLCWDPKTVRERGRDALLRFRMDFLLLLPHGIRVVIEVDGKQHYSDASGRADSHRYSGLVASDRELKLAGYEVFRFSGEELNDKSSASKVKNFFDLVFRRFGVHIPPH